MTSLKNLVLIFHFFVFVANILYAADDIYDNIRVAIKNRNVEEANILLSYNQIIDSNKKNSLWQLAIGNNDAPILDVLFEKLGAPEVYLISLASMTGELESINWLYRKFPESFEPRSDKANIWFMAVKLGNMNLLNWLHENKIAGHSELRDGKTIGRQAEEYFVKGSAWLKEKGYTTRGEVAKKQPAKQNASMRAPEQSLIAISVDFNSMRFEASQAVPQPNRELCARPALGEQQRLKRIRPSKLQGNIVPIPMVVPALKNEKAVANIAVSKMCIPPFKRIKRKDMASPDLNFVVNDLFGMDANFHETIKSELPKIEFKDPASCDCKGNPYLLKALRLLEKEDLNFFSKELVVAEIQKQSSLALDSNDAIADELFDVFLQNMEKIITQQKSQTPGAKNQLSNTIKYKEHFDGNVAESYARLLLFALMYPIYGEQEKFLVDEDEEGELSTWFKR